VGYNSCALIPANRSQCFGEESSATSQVISSWWRPATAKCCDRFEQAQWRKRIHRLGRQVSIRAKRPRVSRGRYRLRGRRVCFTTYSLERIQVLGRGRSGKRLVARRSQFYSVTVCKRAVIHKPGLVFLIKQKDRLLNFVEIIHCHRFAKDIRGLQR